MESIGGNNGGLNNNTDASSRDGFGGTDFNVNEWIIALAHGKIFLGRPGINPWTLSPCYELTMVPIPVPQQVKQPDGSVVVNVQIQTTRQIGAIGGFPSWRNLHLPTDVLMKRVIEFSVAEQAMLAKNITDIEAAFAQQEKQDRAAAMALEASRQKSFGGGARD